MGYFKEEGSQCAQEYELVDILLTKGNKDFDCFCTVVGVNNAMLANKLREITGLGSPQGCNRRPDIHFSAKPAATEHLVQESIWKEPQLSQL